MKRILFLCPDIIGGVKTYVTNITGYLKQQGIDYGIVFYKPINKFVNEKRENEVMQATFLGYSKYSTIKEKYKLFGEVIRQNDILICNDSLELEAINFH